MKCKYMREIDGSAAAWRKWRDFVHTATQMAGPYDLMEIGWRSRHEVATAERRLWTLSRQIVWC